jgi:hypothetical protein
MKKRYKTSKNTNELHILHQNAKKKKIINILKIGYNKKKVVLLLYVLNIKKTLNQNRIADKLSVEVSRFVMMIA